MKKTIYFQAGLVLAIALLFSSCKKDENCDCKCMGSDSTVSTVTVFATGLNNPRGLKFGPDGYLYVAEAGKGGTNSSAGQCAQVPFPVGPYTGSPTGAGVSRISPAGVRTVVTDKLPSSQDNPIVGGNAQGVGDVAFIGNTLYAVLAGAGCSHGVPSMPNSLVRINSDGSHSIIANLSEWFMTHPVKNAEPGDFEPDGEPYSMVYVNDAFYIMEPNHGDFIKVTAAGQISRVVDISATEGHIVPTVLTYRNGDFYVSNLHPFPIVDGSSNVYKITSSGQVSVWATGVTAVLGIVFDDKGRLYILENTTGSPGPAPGTGKIIRINLDGSKETVAKGLTLPTGLTYGPDKNLYVSNNGFGPTAIGGGQVLKIEVTDCKGKGTSKY